jgi:hypothetical protein
MPVTSCRVNMDLLAIQGTELSTLIDQTPAYASVRSIMIKIETFVDRYQRTVSKAFGKCFIYFVLSQI